MRIAADDFAAFVGTGYREALVEILAKEKPGDPFIETYQGGVFVAVEEVANPAAERQGAKK